MEKKYKLSGVGCIMCVQKIQNKLAEVEGVERAIVELATTTLDVAFDENKITADEIKNIVTDLGYGVVADLTENEKTVETEKVEKPAENKEKKDDEVACPVKKLKSFLKSFVQ